MNACCEGLVGIKLRIVIQEDVVDVWVDDVPEFWRRRESRCKIIVNRLGEASTGLGLFDAAEDDWGGK